MKTPLLPTKSLPGDLAMWFFILAELSVFAILFTCFAVARYLNPVMFSEGQAQLHPALGLINTVVLILSSYWVVLAVNLYKTNNIKKSKLMLLFSLVCASTYLLVKYHEYSLLWEAGFSVTTNTFYTLYFFITMFHYLHVVLGMLILSYLYVVISSTKMNHNLIESGAAYWHMVDLVWIILFPLLYVLV